MPPHITVEKEKGSGYVWKEQIYKRKQEQSEEIALQQPPLIVTNPVSKNYSNSFMRVDPL
jgi:hypothetical protein